MGFLLKFKLLWLLSLGLLTQAHIIQRRTIKDTEDTTKLAEALRTPQKYIIEPIQTLTKNADNVEVPPYDAVDFEVEDKFNEIEGEIEDANMGVFEKNVDKVIKTDDDLNKSSLSEKESEQSDNISKFAASINSENNSESTQTAKIPTHLTSDRTTQTSQNNSENIAKLQSSVNSENILDTKTTQTDKESQTNLSPTILTGAPDDVVKSELKSDVDLKNLFSDLVQSLDKDKLLQTYGDNNSNIKNPNTDDSVIEDLTYQNNQLRNIGNLKDSEKQLEDSEIVTKSNEIKSPGSNDSEGHDYEVLTKSTETKSPFSASTTKYSEFVNPTESEFGVDSKSSDFALKSKDSEVLFNLGESKSSASSFKTKNSEKALNPTEFELVSDSTALKTRDSENVLNPTVPELVNDSSALKTKDSENVLSPTDSELIVDSKLPVSILKPQDSEVLFNLGESKSRATALNTKGSKKVSRPINSENTFSGLTYSNEKDNFMPTYENIKTSKKTNSAIKNNRIRNLENSKNSEKPSQITSETKTKDFETLINPTETKSTASTSDDLNIKDSETVTKTSESSIPISEIVKNPSESELPFDSKNLFSDQVALVDDKVLPTYANENSEFKIPNKDSETDNSLAENVSNNFIGLRNLEIVNPDDTKNIHLKTKTDSETPIFTSVLSELPNSENLPKSYLRNVLAENSEKVAELSELPFDSENQFSDLVSTEKYSESKIPNKVSEMDNSVVENLSNNLNGLRNLEIVNPDDTKNVQLKTKTDSETPIFTAVLTELSNSENLPKTYLRNVLVEDSEKETEPSNKEGIKVTNSESLDSKVSEFLNSEKVALTLEPGKVSETTNTVTKQIQNLPESNKVTENSLATELINSEKTPETLEFVRVSETTNTVPNQIQKLPENFKITESTIATVFINSEKVPETLAPVKVPEPINTVTNQVQKLPEITKISQNTIGSEFINSEKIPETLEAVKISETTDTVPKFENSDKVVENIKPTAEKATENVNNAALATKPQINSKNSLATSVDTKAPKKTSENISPILETSGNIEKPLINTASTQNVDDTLTNPTNSVTGHLSSDNKSDVLAVSAETLKPNKPVFALPKPEAQPKPVKTTGKPIKETNEKPVKTTKKPISAPTEKPVKITRKPIASTNENRVKTTLKPIISTTEKLVKVVYISTTSKPIKEITPTVLNTRPPTTKPPLRTTIATRRPSTTRRSTATRRPSATRRPATTKKPISPAADPQQNLANQQNVPQRRPVRPKPNTPVTTATPATNPGLFPNFPSLPPHFQNFPTLPPSLQNFPSLPPHPLNQNSGTSVNTQRPPTNPSWFSNLPSLPPHLQNLPNLPPNFPNLPLPPVNHQNPSPPVSSDPQQNPSNNQNRPQRRPVNSNHNTPVTTQRPSTNAGWFQNFPSLPPNLQNFPRLPTSPVNQNQGASAANQRPPTNPTRFPNLPPNLQNLSPNLQNFPNLSSPPVLPAFFVNPFNTTTSTNNQTQSTFGIGFLAVPWNWRPRNFTNIFTPNRVLDDAPAVTPPSPLDDNEETPEVARDLAFWNALFHRGFNNNSGVFKQWSSGPKLNDTPSTNATTTSFWKPWSSDFFKIPKFNYSSFNTTATIPSNTQVLHLYLPLKYPFQGQIVTSPSQRKNDETITSSISNKLEFIPKFQRSSIKSEDAAKKTEVIADTDKLVGEEKASLMFELELPKPIVKFVKGIMDTFWTQAS